MAEITDRTPAACRQLASSARRRLRVAHAESVPPARQAVLVQAFKQAWENQDINALIGILDPDATAVSDGGGIVEAVVDRIEGADDVAHFYVELAGRAGGSVTLVERTVNGQPGLVAQQRDGSVVTVFAFNFGGGGIKNIWAVRNPEKLCPWTAS